MTLPHGFTPCEECREKLRAAVRAERARKAAKSKPRREATKVARAERRDNEQAIRAEVMVRPGPACELGSHEVFPGTFIDAHHLEPGSNRRHGKVSTLIRACRDCHDHYHRSEYVFVEAVKAWCAKHGYPLPNRKVYR